MVTVLLAVVVGLALVVGISSSASAARAADARLAAWRRIAGELGLIMTGDENDRSIGGVLKGVPVRLDYRRQAVMVGKVASVVQRTTILAGGDGRIPGSLEVRKDSAVHAIGRLLYGRDEEIGDESFDELVELPSMDAPACAALSFAARRDLASLIKMGGEVREGALVWEASTSEVEETDAIAPVLQFFARLGGLLAVPPGSLCQSLAENATADPSPGVRLRNLGFLCDASTRAPRELIAKTAVALLADAHAPVRLLAAKQLGRLGSATLSELASNAQQEPALRVEALQQLHELGADELDGALTACLYRPPTELACAALKIITERRLAAHWAAVVDCATSAEEPLRINAALALGAIAPEGAESILVDLLADDSSDVQQASVEALGQIGSVAAVEPLLRIANAFGNAPLRQAARAAIGRIQSGLAHVEAGAISLADPEDLAGAVDVVEARALRVGHVSLSEDALAEGQTDRVAAPIDAARSRNM